jgi:hypothetical protein
MLVHIYEISQSHTAEECDLATSVKELPYSNERKKYLNERTINYTKIVYIINQIFISSLVSKYTGI